VLVAQGSTRYTQDLQAPLSQVLSDSTATHVYGYDRLASRSGSTRTWYSSDALGSVRQTLNDGGSVATTTAYDPWGQVTQGSVATFGFTGELQQDDAIYLRARWYQPSTGTLLGRDPFAGYEHQPASLHPYVYVANDPTNRVDPSGLYWWGPSEAFLNKSHTTLQSENVHIRIQALMMVGAMDQVHAEYTIPVSRMKVDLLHSVLGDVWEIKPWDDLQKARVDARRHTVGMNEARIRGDLCGTNPIGLQYNWNLAPAIWDLGTRFPAGDLYIGTDGTGTWDIWAAQTEPGVILWWKYPRAKPIIVPQPIHLPRWMVYSKRNIRPNWRPSYAPAGATQPAPSTTPRHDPVFPPLLLPPLPSLSPKFGGGGGGNALPGTIGGGGSGLIELRQ
jgi:RHS repeat-associated protein